MAQNLGAKLVGELKRGGKKTIVLALLIPVSAYFWVPLLKGSSDDDPPPPTTGADKKATASSDVPTSTKGSTSTSAKPDDWKKLQTRLDELPLFKPAPIDNLVRDPFDRGWIDQKLARLRSQAAADTVAAEDPINRLELSGVVVGPSGGAAIIGEAVYRVGQRVPEEGPIQYTLKTVERARVVLERDGKTFELALKQKDRGASQ
jgi:hypothetical protein